MAFKHPIVFIYIDIFIYIYIYIYYNTYIYIYIYIVCWKQYHPLKRAQLDSCRLVARGFHVCINLYIFVRIVDRFRGLFAASKVRTPNR
jgi:hypothetical protein